MGKYDMNIILIKKWPKYLTNVLIGKENSKKYETKTCQDTT